MKSSAIQVKAPVQGWVMPLSDVPDQAFAEKMVGDGVAIDPIGGEIRSPCDGEILSVHRSRHALTLRAENGAELLLHVGVDTVTLNGEGFKSHVADGQSVKTGDVLLTFDMDAVAAHARGLQTMVIVTNGDDYVIGERLENQPIAEGGFLMDVAPTAAALVRLNEERVASEDEEERKTVQLLIAGGLHARPAALLANRAKSFGAHLVEVALKGRTANAKSIVSLMSLGARYGDTLTVRVQGDGAQRVVDDVVGLIASGLGDLVVPITEAAGIDAPEIEAKPDFAVGADVVLKGAAAAPGTAVGVAVRLKQADIEVEEQGKGSDAEKADFAAALATAKNEIEAAVHAASERKDEAQEGIFRAHCGLLDDPELTESALELIAAGKSAGFAWRASIERYVGALRALDDPMMAERINDLRDLEQRILSILTGRTQTVQILPDKAILVAETLMPSQLIGPEAGKIVGTCTASGGSTAHVSILAAAMGIPAVVAVGREAMRIADGATLILDGDRGSVRINPASDALIAAREKIAARQERAAANILTAQDPCVMTDGQRISVLANLARTQDASGAMTRGADGCGLLRTEFLFMGRAAAPSEDEQFAEYQAIATALDGRPLVIRTLDAGGDKPMPYIRLEREDNPALGVRGIRVGMLRPELLRTQVRAILRVAPFSQCKIMAPMVSSLAELRFVRTIVEEERAKLGRGEPIDVGIMVEVPAAAAIADVLADESDFFSVGTNDLTQYVLGIDRGNASLALQYDSMHPAVLRAIAQAAEGAGGKGRPVSVCGGMASDPLAAPLLIGLGVKTLSATANAVPDLKAFIRTLRFDLCRELAQKALRADSPEAVRKLVADRWPGL